MTEKQLRERMAWSDDDLSEDKTKRKRGDMREPEGDHAVTTVRLGGKPNQGTKKDKRLDDNKYSDAGDCPPGMEPGPDGECMDIAKEEKMASAPTETAEVPEVLEMDETQTAPWQGPIAIEGVTTGDGREFELGKLSWSEEIAPGEVLLRWNKEDSHGGEARTKAVAVGRIDRIWREDNLIMAEGLFDLGQEDGREAHRRVKAGFLRGVSIDADMISDAIVEYVWPDNANEGMDDDDLFSMLFGQPEKTIFHGGRIRGATLCDIPAFVEAYIALPQESNATLAAGQRYPELVQHHGVARRTVDGLVAHGGPDWKPPTEWFRDPQLSVPTGIQVTDDGRVYGHAAQWGSCHIGQTDVCVQPPQEDGHPYFLTGEMGTKEGRTVSVGQITVGTGHAPLHLGAVPATEHYEHTGHAVADVAVGNDQHGIWVAGAIRPNADPLLVHELRASGQVSGDWRRIKNKLRLVGLLAVNIPGFPVPQMKTQVASGAQTALVAAGRPTVAHALTEAEIVQRAYRVVMNDLFKSVHGGSDRLADRH